MARSHIRLISFQIALNRASVARRTEKWMASLRKKQIGRSTESTN